MSYLHTAAILLSLSVAPAYASPSFSGGVSLLHSWVDTNFAGTGFSTHPTATIEDHHSGIGLALTGEVAWTPTTRFKLGFARFGGGDETARRSVDCPGSCPPDLVVLTDVEQSAMAGWLAYAPSFGAGAWRLSPRLGVALVRRTSEFDGIEDTDSSTELVVGASAARPLSPNTEIRIDLNRFGAAATSIGVGIGYRFGGG